MQKRNIDYKQLSDIEIYELVLQGKMPCFPSGFWSSISIEKAQEVAISLLHYLLSDKLKYSTQDILNIVSKQFLIQYKLHTASKFFGRSPIKFVMSAYPGIFHPWQFLQNRVPDSFWTIEENRIEALRYIFEIELQWNIEDIKEKLTWDMIKKKGLLTLHTYYSNLYQIVNAVYPGAILPFELKNSEVPKGTWDNKNNRILAINWLLNNENSNKNINRKTFVKYGLSNMLGLYYCDNPKRAINEVLNL